VISVTHLPSKIGVLMPLNGNGVWKVIAIAFIGVMIGIGTEFLRTPKDVVTEKELTLRVVELQGKIDIQTTEIIALRSSVNQQAVDIAGIATKVGVTAHPVIAPR
jgi:hypothetical protein